MNNISNNNAYDRAKKKVEKEKGFYGHLTAYIIINVAIILISIDFGRGDFQNWLRWNLLTTPFFWGIGLAIHAINVFMPKTSFLKKWEEKKMKQYLDEDNELFKSL